MSEQKVRVAVLFGGDSPEHEVSLVSAASVLQAIDREKLAVVPVGIARTGEWLAGDGALAELRQRALEQPGPRGAVARSLALPEPSGAPPVRVTFDAAAGVLLPGDAALPIRIDVVFPVMHGRLGEDGAIQGLLELAGLPYVGPGVLGSSLAMDKHRTKLVLRQEGIPVADWFAVETAGGADAALAGMKKNGFSYPVFVKPARCGSSVGVGKATGDAELAAQVVAALTFDELVLVERAVLRAREIECAVLGNLTPESSVPGEVVPSHEFYDYEDKYVGGAARLLIPAPLSSAQAERCRSLAIAAFRAVDGEGMARVDFLLAPQDGEIVVNEINTIPGFTPISMYPKLWAASGLPYPELIDRLVHLACERHERKRRLRA
ncbi:MAG: D-alanine--D-alanine ligase [Candidatus Schekmanbacteria bacterium]|nr:D-alanine--D-alanine ligase [Candidatus Schekmanbacteria bacterium]